MPEVFRFSAQLSAVQKKGSATGFFLRGLRERLSSSRSPAENKAAVLHIVAWRAHLLGT